MSPTRITPRPAKLDCNSFSITVMKSSAEVQVQIMIFAVLTLGLFQYHLLVL